MIWNVYRENANTRKIEVYNVFNHASFSNDIKEAYLTCETRAEFDEKLRKSLMYYFYSEYFKDIKKPPALKILL